MDLRSALQSKFVLSENGLKATFVDYACVAVLLRGKSFQELEIAYIRRAIHETDRWSGQIAFPGGRSEPEDFDDLATALRETHEEVGIELSQTHLVGRLDDIQARKGGQLLEFYIRPFVFFVDQELSPVLNPDEVADFFWIKVSELKDQSRQMQYELQKEELAVMLPAIRMQTDPPLWGLTYMMTQDLLRRI